MPAHGVAVGYARRSTDKQETSIEDQAKEIQDYADKHGYRIIRWYSDDAISGDDTENRHGFKQLLTDAQQQRDYSVVICWDQSRFGRFSPQEAGYWTYLFSQAGVSLVTVDKGLVDWNDFTGWLTYGVNQHSKHDFLKQLSKDVARGQKEAAGKGSWLGQPPYGYRIEGEKKNKRLVIDTTGKVKVVQRIFREFVEDGRSMSEIARRLVTDNIVSPGEDRPWRYDSVRSILENPAYCGDYVSGRYSYGKYNSIHGEQPTPTNGKRIGKRGLKRNPESKWIVRRDNHESIIDRATYERAQTILARGKEGRNAFTPETNPFLFTGLLRCGKCGCPMWGDTVHRRDGKGKRRDEPPVKFYRCGNWQTNGASACKGTKVSEECLLGEIADYLYDEFLSLDGKALAWKADRKELQPSDLPEAFAKVRAVVAPPKHQPGNHKRLESQLKELDAKLAKARGNLVLLDAENIPDAQERIRRMQTERDGVAAELAKRPPNEADINTEATEVLRSLYWLWVLFASAADEAKDPEGLERDGGLFGAGQSPQLRKYLRHIASITVNSTTTGKGTATRHIFEKGEITFAAQAANATSTRHHGKGEPYPSQGVLPNRSFTLRFGPAK